MGKKIVINKCYGGFGLSPLATKELAALQGRECHFFKDVAGGYGKDQYRPVSLEEAGTATFWSAFDTPDVASILSDYSAHSLYNSSIARDDAHLVAVVEKLGEAANGQFAKLEIVEIPDDVEWELDEYDGVERIAEVHRTWG